jgi:hypothetical protein
VTTRRPALEQVSRSGPTVPSACCTGKEAANPITAATDTLRSMLLGGPVLGPVLETLAWSAALTVVFAPLAIRQYRRLP